MKPNIQIIPLLVFVVLSVFAIFALYDKPEERTSFQPFDLPAFKIETLDGKPFTQEDFRGKYNILHVFASWCVTCRAEHPLFVSLSEAGADHLYGMVWKDKKASAEQWLKQLGNPYDEVLYDPEGTFGVGLGITGIPETFVIDNKGQVVYRHAGPISVEFLKTDIVPYLEQNP